MAIKIYDICDITTKDMDLINGLEENKLMPKLKPESVFIFEFKLCNNKVDENYEVITPTAIMQLKDKYIGHKGNINNFKERPTIFDSYVDVDKDVDEPCLNLKVKAYVLNNKISQEFINWIKDTTIQKEVNICFSAERPFCSICEHRECEHLKGEYYHNSLCIRKITEVSDVYEWSIEKKIE